MAKKPNKLHIPSATVGATIEEGNVKTAMKSAEAVSTEMWNVPLDKIKPIPGFNVRVDSADYVAHRDMLVESFKANGYDDTKPLAGFVGKDGEENVIYVTDGYTRRDAAISFNADPDVTEDRELKTLPVVVRKPAPSMEDLTVALHTNNTGRPLTPFELGVVVKRLLAGEGADKAAIAKRLAVTPRYLDDVLLLADAPAGVRNHVLTGEFSSTAAIQELRRNPEEAADRIAAAVAKAKSTGKKKATAKDVGTKMRKVAGEVEIKADSDMKAMLKEVAAFIREHVTSDATGEVELTKVFGKVKLVIETPAPVKEPAKPKAKPAAKAKPAPAAKPKAEPAAKPKTAASKKAAAKPADAVVEGATPVAAEEDEEIALVPPAVASDPNVPNDDNI